MCSIHGDELRVARRLLVVVAHDGRHRARLLRRAHLAGEVPAGVGAVARPRAAVNERDRASQLRRVAELPAGGVCRGRARRAGLSVDNVGGERPQRQRRAEGGGLEVVVPGEGVGRLDVQARAHLERARQQREARGGLDALYSHVQGARQSVLALLGLGARDELGVRVRDQDHVAVRVGRLPTARSRQASGGGARGGGSERNEEVWVAAEARQHELDVGGTRLHTRRVQPFQDSPALSSLTWPPACEPPYPPVAAVTFMSRSSL